MGRKTAIALLSTVIVPLLLTLAAGTAGDAATSPGITQRLSVSGSGAQANAGSNWPSLRRPD
jgi:hypothetical protein